MFMTILAMVILTSLLNIQKSEAKQSKEASALLRSIQKLPSKDCFEPMNIGGYMANHEFWYFDSSILRCKPFRYGGEQQHNGNHFETWMDCFAKCRAYFS